jgi:hypothetical protein
MGGLEDEFDGRAAYQHKYGLELEVVEQPHPQSTRVVREVVAEEVLSMEESEDDSSSSDGSDSGSSDYEEMVEDDE